MRRCPLALEGVLRARADPGEGLLPRPARVRAARRLRTRGADAARRRSRRDGDSLGEPLAAVVIDGGADHIRPASPRPAAPFARIVK